MSVIPMIDPIKFESNVNLNISITDNIKEQFKNLYHLNEEGYNTFSKYCNKNRIFDNPSTIEVIRFVHSMLHFLNNQHIDLKTREVIYEIVETFIDTYNAFIKSDIGVKSGYICYKTIVTNKEVCAEHYRNLINSTLTPIRQNVVNKLNTFCDKYNLQYDDYKVHAVLDELLDASCSIIMLQLVQSKEYVLNDNLSFSTYSENSQDKIGASIVLVIDKLVQFLITSILQQNSTEEEVNIDNCPSNMLQSIDALKYTIFDYIIDKIDNILQYAHNCDAISNMLFASFIVSDTDKYSIDAINHCTDILENSTQFENNIEMQESSTQDTSLFEIDDNTTDITNNQTIQADTVVDTPIACDYDDIMRRRNKYTKSPINKELIDNIPPNFIANLLKES